MEDSGTNTKINWLFILLLFQKGSFRQLGRGKKKKEKRKKERPKTVLCCTPLRHFLWGKNCACRWTGEACVPKELLSHSGASMIP